MESNDQTVHKDGYQVDQSGKEVPHQDVLGDGAYDEFSESLITRRPLLLLNFSLNCALLMKVAVAHL